MGQRNTKHNLIFLATHAFSLHKIDMFHSLLCKKDQQ